jgi:alkylhydroperoxidase family enzyme
LFAPENETSKRKWWNGVRSRLYSFQFGGRVGTKRRISYMIRAVAALAIAQVNCAHFCAHAHSKSVAIQAYG